VVLSLGPPARARLLDVSHELILDEPARYGWAAFHIGAPSPVTPRWAPDGKWIAYLKRSGGAIQVWRVLVQGGGATQVSRAQVDVDDFRIAADGRTIVYAARPHLLERESEVDREGLRGWRYDDRAFPVRGARPQTPNAQTRYVAADIEGGIERAASEEEAALFVQSHSIAGKTIAHAIGPTGQEAWGEMAETPIFPPNYRLVVKQANRQLACLYSICNLDWASSIWWSGDGKRVRFTRREGWANSLTAIYDWFPGGSAPRLIYSTLDDLVDCQPLANDLLCLRERSREPRHFVRLMFDSGKEQRIFNPNPEFVSLSLGRVRRLNWLNGFQVPFYGDLVYPVDYKAGHRYPLVIVQYRTKGFLRGGIGDEVPVQVFANNGYFVLTVDNLTYHDIVGRQKSQEAWIAAFNHKFIGRRNILSAVETATRSLIDQGLVDANRVGITGLSDGCTTVQYAAINSTLFSAGSVSGCGWEPMQDAFSGPMVAKSYHESGWPRLVDKNPSFWAKISLMDQPWRARFPLLFQTADNEYLAMVGSHTALTQAGVPSDLYIFPNEDHIKWQPAHRLAVYRRNIAWFDFWLKDILPSASIERQEAERWREMKQKWHPGVNTMHNIP
jgi:dipeptidyl aminopeptidase/acylaminoacyl peptidase